MVRPVPQVPRWCECRNDLIKDFQSLATNFRRLPAETGDIRTGAVEGLDNARSYRIADADEDDRYC